MLRLEATRTDCTLRPLRWYARCICHSISLAALLTACLACLAESVVIIAINLPVILYNSLRYRTCRIQNPDIPGAHICVVRGPQDSSFCPPNYQRRPFWILHGSYHLPSIGPLVSTTRAVDDTVGAIVLSMTMCSSLRCTLSSLIIVRFMKYYRTTCFSRQEFLSCLVLYLHSAKGGAVETGCSDLNGVIYYFTI